MPGKQRTGYLELLGASVMMVLGLMVFLYPLLRGGLGRAPGDLGDGRFIHYLLEHSWQWITRNPNHPLWDPPYYYPIRGAGAYTDLMAGAGPLYWPWRLMGIEPAGAYNAWLITVAGLNITVAYLVFWRCLRFTPVAAAAGATFLSIAAPLANQSNHPQMLPQFFVLGVLAGLVMLIRSGEGSTPPANRLLWSAVIVTSFVLQMYTAFYYAWLMLLAGGIALLWTMLLPQTRPTVIESVRRSWRPLLVCGFLGGIALVPWAVHYLDAATLNDPLTYEQMSGWIPRWESWLYPGPNSPLYEWMLDWRQFDAIPTDTNHEHRLGVGLLTLMLVVLGYLLNWRKPWAWIGALVAVTLVLMTTIVPGGITAWKLFFELLPGAPAVRTLTRVVLLVLLPMAIGLALLVNRLQHGRRYLLVPFLFPFILAEQAIAYPTYSIQEGIGRSIPIAEAIPEGCGSFLYSPDVRATPGKPPPTYVIQLDAMWAGVLADIPTVNAYGHIVPPGWGFGEPAITGPADNRRLAGAIGDWEERHPAAAPICQVIP